MAASRREHETPVCKQIRAARARGVAHAHAGAEEDGESVHSGTSRDIYRDAPDGPSSSKNNRTSVIDEHSCKHVTSCVTSK